MNRHVVCQWLMLQVRAGSPAWAGGVKEAVPGPGAATIHPRFTDTRAAHGHLHGCHH